MRFYFHKTDGGAKYLCSEKVEGTKDEGSFNSKFIVRIDGDIRKDAELFIHKNFRKWKKNDRSKSLLKNDAIGSPINKDSPLSNGTTSPQKQGEIKK